MDQDSNNSKQKQMEVLLGLLRRAREANTLEALRFTIVNDTHLLAPYRQSALWSREGGVECISGLMQVESNAPFVLWLDDVFDKLSGRAAGRISKTDFGNDVTADWDQWFGEFALWIPLEESGTRGLLFSRPMSWTDEELALMQEWSRHWFALAKAYSGRGGLGKRLLTRLPTLLRRRPLVWSFLAIALLLIPVRLSVLAPAELVPEDPWVVRAPFDGTLKRVLVDTNDEIKEGQSIFEYDTTLLESRLQVVQAELETAEAEYRQASQWALQEAKARGSLPAARGKVEEKRLELDYLRNRLALNSVVAEVDGIAFVESPAEWAGRPLVAGQQVMRLADPNKKEIEAWVAVGDAISLEEGDRVRLYLSSSPLDPVVGEVRFVSHEAIRRPNGTFAFRVRAKISEVSAHRVGLRGTARLSSGRVPSIYWMLRRPIASVRQFFGW